MIKSNPYIKPEALEGMLRDARTVLRPGHVPHTEYLAKVQKYSRPVTLEVPTGELIGPLSGFAWAWKMKGKLEGPHDITGKEGFNAQGLEGKYRVKVPLWDALIASTQTSGPYRMAVWEDRKHNPITRPVNNNPWWPWKATRSTRRRVRRVPPPESRRWGTGRKIMLTLSPARYEQWQREGICIDPRKRNPLTRRETARLLRIRRTGALVPPGVSQEWGTGYRGGWEDATRVIAYQFGTGKHPTMGHRKKRRPGSEARYTAFNPREHGTGSLFFHSKAAATAYAREHGWNTTPQHIPLRVPRGKV